MSKTTFFWRLSSSGYSQISKVECNKPSGGLFVAVPIQLGGATPGQWLCRCRSESLTGEPATLGQLLLRVGCFFLLPFAVATLGAWLCRPDPDGFVNGWSAITSLALQFSTFLLFAIPMLFRKDHRGPHEWLSGTRTVITG